MERLYSFFAQMFDLLAPPRRGTAALRTLSEETLSLLVPPGYEEGLLPYREPVVRALVWELKYHRSARAAALAGAIVADALIDIAADELGTVLLIPAPMHAARRKEREHNQTEILCIAAQKALLHKDIEAAERYVYTPEALVRTRRTPQQQTPALAKS